MYYELGQVNEEDAVLLSDQTFNFNIIFNLISLEHTKGGERREADGGGDPSLSH